jgi:hypothetical protein
VTVELLQRWLADDYPASQPPSDSSSELAVPVVQSRIEWLENWLRLGKEASQKALPGPSAREILEEGRNRLERR